MEGEIKMDNSNNWQCRWSPTLGELEATHQEVWGTVDYTNDTDPTVFFGCYGLPDFYTIWRHRGRRAILWAGTDIIHLRNNYWLEDGGGITIDNKGICQWLNKYCENWCENEREAEVLKAMGITAQVCPSFLGDVKKFQVSFKPGNKVYASVSSNDFIRYGWYEINRMGRQYPDIEFHLYGNTKDWKGDSANVIVHGRVPKRQMNAEIKNMQGALRPVYFDGFSEVLAKSVLWGQYPISLIKYPYMLSIDELEQITEKKEPNLLGRAYYLANLNNYPWNLKK